MYNNLDLSITIEENNIKNLDKTPVKSKFNAKADDTENLDKDDNLNYPYKY